MSDDDKHVGTTPSNTSSANSTTIPDNQLPPVVNTTVTSSVSPPQFLTFQEEEAVRTKEEERLRNEVTQSKKEVRKEIIKTYLNSQEFKHNNELKIRARVKTVLNGVSQAKSARAQILIEEFKSEGSWCTFAMEDCH